MSDIQQTPERFTPKLDDMLTRAEAAKWLQITERTLSERSRGLRPKIVAFDPGGQGARYHPRTIITKLARDAGVPMDQIAASFGIFETKSS